MAISGQNHSKLITDAVVGKFKEDIPVKSGFSEMFPRETTPALLVDVKVERDNDLIAIDVKRFAEGNKNKSTISTEKKYQPPFFKEDYDFARDEVYMSSAAHGLLDNKITNGLIAQNGLDGVRTNKKKIERAIRKQQADVLMTGIIELKNGDNIDYKRKAASIVTLPAAGRWDAATADPIANLEVAMRFLRDVGNSNGSVINVVMRTKAQNALLSNDKFKELADNRRINRVDIAQPQFDKVSGMAFHGQVPAGDFMVNIWTYNEKYTDKDGNIQYYLDEDKVIVLPDDFRGKTVFGGLPYMKKGKIAGTSVGMPAVMKADFLVRNYTDEKTISSVLELTSAPLVVPFTIDKVYTLSVFEVV